MDDEAPDVGDLLDELEALEDTIDDPDAREQVADAIETAVDLQRDSPAFGRVIHGFDRADLAEATLGSVLFCIPMVVESGTGDAGAFVAARPLAFAGTLVATLALVYGVLYVADIQDVRVANPIFGVIPRRLVGVIAASLLTTTLVFTGWGQLPADHAVAAGTIAVAWGPTALGAALGDILPGS